MRSGSTSLAYFLTVSRTGWYWDANSTSNPAAFKAAIIVNSRRSGWIVTLVVCADTAAATSAVIKTAVKNRKNMVDNDSTSRWERGGRLECFHAVRDFDSDLSWTTGNRGSARINSSSGLRAFRAVLESASPGFPQPQFAAQYRSLV